MNTTRWPTTRSLEKHQRSKYQWWHTCKHNDQQKGQWQIFNKMAMVVANSNKISTTTRQLATRSKKTSRKQWGAQQQWNLKTTTKKKIMKKTSIGKQWWKDRRPLQRQKTTRHKNS